jgi:hypothetical protein
MLAERAANIDPEGFLIAAWIGAKPLHGPRTR